MVGDRVLRRGHHQIEPGRRNARKADMDRARVPAGAVSESLDERDAAMTGRNREIRRRAQDEVSGFFSQAEKRAAKQSRTESPESRYKRVALFRTADQALRPARSPGRCRPPGRREAPRYGAERSDFPWSILSPGTISDRTALTARSTVSQTGSHRKLHRSDELVALEHCPEFAEVRECRLVQRPLPQPMAEHPMQGPPDRDHPDRLAAKDSLGKHRDTVGCHMDFIAFAQQGAEAREILDGGVDSSR